MLELLDKLSFEGRLKGGSRGFLTGEWESIFTWMARQFPIFENDLSSVGEARIAGKERAAVV